MGQLLQNIRSRIRYRASILAATFASYSLYYRYLLWHYVRNVNTLRPRPFLDSFRMMRMVYSVREYTAVFVPRLVTLYKLSKEVNQRSLPGDFVECGVYNGVQPLSWPLSAKSPP